MKFSILFLALCLADAAYSQGIFSSIIKAPADILRGAGDALDGVFGRKHTSDPCSRDVEPDYRKAMVAFHNKIYARVAAGNDNHFVFSPYNIWLSLSALAEGADRSIQRKFFSTLNLPQERCLRTKYYDIAMNAEEPSRDVNLERQRSLILNDGIKLNPSWSNLVTKTELLEVEFAPFKKNPQKASAYLRKVIGTRSDIILRANSLLVNTLDYQGLWTTAFAEANIMRQPFYNDLGQQIGTVNMMHMKKQVRLAQVPFMDAKVLELPVGRNGRYTMLVAMGTGDNFLKNAISVFMSSILEIFSLLQMSLIPLKIAVPRFDLRTELQMRRVLEDVGMVPFWKNPAATRHVSSPPAMPGDLMQRVSVKIDSEGVEPPPVVGTDPLSGLVNLAADTATGVASAVGHDFIADRPFMFALFDTKSHTCLFAGAYSIPEDD